MSKQLVIPSGYNDGWEYVFRKASGRPIEMLKRHQHLGRLGGWQVANNFCLKAIISMDDLEAHFKDSTKIKDSIQ